MRVFLFDFDETLNYLSTDFNPNATSRTVYHAGLFACKTDEERNNFIRDNVKPGVAELFRKIWKAEGVIAVSTFSNSPSHVFAHFRAIGLSEEEISKITIEFRPENFDNSITKKSESVSKILTKLGRKIEEVIYAEDTQRHLDDVSALLKSRNIACRTHLVPRAKEGREAQCAFISEISQYINTLQTAKIFESILTRSMSEDEICALIDERNANQFDGENLFSLLHYAAKFGLPKLATTLIASRAKINCQNDSGRTPLHEAAENGCENVLGVLIAANAAQDIFDKRGDTALDLAVEAGHLSVVNALLADGSNPNKENPLNANTPLHLASKNGHLNVALALIERGAKMDAKNCDQKDPSHLAENRDMVELLSNIKRLKIALEAGQEPEVRRLIKLTGCANLPFGGAERQSSPLHYYAEKNDRDMVAILIKAGAKLVLNSYGETALHIAARGGFKTVCKQLLEMKNVSFEPNNQEESPLELACKHLAIEGDKKQRALDRLEIMCDLIKAQPSQVVRVDAAGQTILHKIAQLEIWHQLDKTYVTQIIGLLVKNGANINAGDTQGNTPLALAALSERSAHPCMVNALIENGAQLEAPKAQQSQSPTANRYKIFVEPKSTAGKDVSAKHPIRPKQ